jgi:predicted adenine nucleotide alpha hydrolase (AANH) superfamily ATPase
MKLRRSYKVALAIGWFCIIFYLLSARIPAGMSLGFSYEDKLIHATLFGIFVYLLIEALESFYVLKYSWVVAISLLLTIIYAQSMEDFQALLGYRTKDFADTLAGASGALLATAAVYWHDFRRPKKPKLLLHMCCIGCGVAVIEKLQADYDIVLFFYNPNIFPKTELKKRLVEIRRIARTKKLQVVVSRASHKSWLHKIKGHEHEPERGGRCVICYQDRLEQTARRAKRLGFTFYTSTLSISPHKTFEVIKQLGQTLGSKYAINFLAEDFKKNNGFKRGCELSKELNLYRQDYCGCEFSISKDANIKT